MFHIETNHLTFEERQQTEVADQMGVFQSVIRRLLNPFMATGIPSEQVLRHGRSTTVAQDRFESITSRRQPTNTAQELFTAHCNGV